jgi:hypothetical protein
MKPVQESGWLTLVLKTGDEDVYGLPNGHWTDRVLTGGRNMGKQDEVCFKTPIAGRSARE